MGGGCGDVRREGGSAAVGPPEGDRGRRRRGGASRENGRGHCRRLGGVA